MSSSQDTPNYYAMLGIPNGSTDQVINAAYRKLVLVYHPDKTGGDELLARRFHQIREAIETLRDPDRRHAHDEALTTDSYKINTIHRKLHRYYASDDRRNWFQEIPPWSSDHRKYNFDDPNDRYMFTYGTAVHMDPDSEASRAEKARHQKDIEEWEMRWQGIYPDVQRKKREFRKASMGNLVKRDEAEMQQVKTPQAKSDPSTEEKKPADRYMESEQLHAKDKGVCDDHIGERCPVYGDYSPLSPDTSFDLSTATANTSIWPSIPMEDSFATDKSDPKHIMEADNSGHLVDDDHSIIDSTSELDKPDPLACHDSHGATKNEKTDEALQPFVQFFAMKLENHSTRYKVEDMHAEMQGLMLEIYVAWLEGARLSLAPGTDPSMPVIDRHGNCCYSGPWIRTFGVPECHKCHLWMPTFILTCPHCGREACIRCKFSGN